MSRALVTGCAGFIGSHLTESLLADGHDVLGIDCFNDNYDVGLKQANLECSRGYARFRLEVADLARTDLEAMLEDRDVVFHLAAEPGVRPSWGGRFDRYVHNNVVATQRLLEAAASRPERRFVYASSSSVYGDAESLPTAEDALPRPLSPYGVTKLAAEQLCSLYHAEHGVETVALRFFSVYGPRQRPDMAFRRFCHAALDRRADPAVRRRPPDARLHLCRGHRRRRPRRRGSAARRGRRLQHRRRLAREPQPHARSARRRRGRAARRTPAGARDGRRLPHRRGHRARPRRPRLCPADRPRGRPARRAGLGGRARVGGG